MLTVALAAVLTSAPHVAGALADMPNVASPYAGSSSLPDGVRITLGASVVTAPLFEGSARYGAWAVPIVKFDPLPGSAGSSGGLLSAVKSFDARSIDDISVGIFKHGGLEIGPLVGYRIGRQEKDSTRLKGFGDIDGGFVAGAYVRYDLQPFFVRASLHHHVTGDDTGYLVRLAAGSEIPIARGVVLKADAYLDLADNTYMDVYFGVSGLQSQRSGRAMFDPSSGLKSIGLSLGTEIALNRDWSLHLNAGYSRLVGDAASSPIVETADRLEARVGLARSFDLRW